MSENERKSMIKVRGGFSERIGKPLCTTTIQLNEFDNRTRIFISNLLFDFLQITFQNDAQFRKQPYGNTPVPLSSDFCKNLGQDVFSFRNHLQEGYVYNWVDFYTSNIENALDNAPYNEILDLLEYICNWLFAKTNSCSEHFQRNFNTLFQQEYVGYRFISKRIVATVYKGNIIKNLIMDCQSYTKYRPNETTGGIFVSWRRKEELPTGA